MRLAEPLGSLLNRKETVRFHFDGNPIEAYAGDTIASALAANGIRVLSRSFKYHRPRGILSMSGQDSHALVQVDDEPNVRADTRLIEEGMRVSAQNVFGSLDRDYASVLGKLGRFLPVGFYYKTFFRPKGVWRFWEKVIRRLAGLGEVSLDTRTEETDKHYRFIDVAVIGAGAAGMSAAIEAADAGAKVLLIEENTEAGGALNYARFTPGQDKETNVRDEMISRVTAHENIELLCQAQCTGWFEDNWLSVFTFDNLIKLRAGAVVLASGSFEQPAVFRNNDLPGVMFCGAAQKLIRLYGVKPGKRAVVLACNDDGYATALDLHDAGVEVAAILDMRMNVGNSSWPEVLEQKKITVHTASAVYEALPLPGNKGLKSIARAGLDEQGALTAVHEEIECDLLCMNAGYSPAAQLICHFGGRLVYDETDAMLKLDGMEECGLREKALAAGSVNGVFDIDNVLADGRRAGQQAATLLGLNVENKEALFNDTSASSQNFPWPIIPHPKGKEFIDYDEDLQVNDIERAVAEGYEDLNLVKRYSTVVMGPSQGRQSALNNLRLAGRSAGRALQGESVTTQRPPFHPETIQLLAGRSLQPLRRTAMHQQHLALGAKMFPAGLWHRPEYYGDKTSARKNIESEYIAIREGVGLIDVSTLGKLDIRGPDAGEFINRLYTGKFDQQKLNHVGYALLTDETGVLVDDGVCCRLAEHHYYVTTTSGGVDGVYRNMLRWNAEWRLKVDIANITSAFAAVNLAGPVSRKVLEKVCDDIDLSAETLGFSRAALGHVAGITARIMRVGFVGELGYEIHVPSSQGAALWDYIMEAGKVNNIQPVGIEAQRLLRLEKGHIIIGQDTDGLTTLAELGMNWAVSKKKDFFVGKRSIDILGKNDLSRKLVGFELPPNSSLPQESNLTLRDGNIAGRVTSVARSKVLDKVIGLAYVHPEQTVVDTQFEIKLSDGERLMAKVVQIPFYDPDAKRQAI